MEHIEPSQYPYFGPWVMTCVLRFIDVRYLLPKRVAFQEALDAEVVAGGSLKNEEERPRDADLKTPTTSTRVDE